MSVVRILGRGLTAVGGGAIIACLAYLVGKALHWQEGWKVLFTALAGPAYVTWLFVIGEEN